MIRLALLGRSVEASLSPPLHRAWLDAVGIDGRYDAFSLPDHTTGEELLRFMAARRLDGVNLTVPFKRRISHLLDDLDPEARRTGAVNTVYRREGRWFGANTDIAGFRAELAHVRGDPARLVLLGAGGAARAVLIACLPGVERLTLLNRTPARARELAAQLAPSLSLTVGMLEQLPAHARRATLVVNALAGPGACAIRGLAAPLTPGATWIDLNYWMDDPPHLDALRARGCRVGDGLRMLVVQGAEAFALFTGRAPPIERGFTVLERLRRRSRGA